MAEGEAKEVGGGREVGGCGGWVGWLVTGSGEKERGGRRGIDRDCVWCRQKARH